jgi:hypothetical protein
MYWFGHGVFCLRGEKWSKITSSSGIDSTLEEKQCGVHVSIHGFEFKTTDDEML